MKTIIKGISQKIYLDQATIGSGKTIYLNIVGEDGNYLTNNTGDELKSLQLIYDSDLQKYFYEVTINETEATQYIRLYFYSSEINVNSDYYPEDAYLDSNVLAPIAEIVPFGFFKEFYLNIRGKIDKSHQTIIDSYLADKKGLQNKLLSAQNKLELALEMFLTARDYIEKRDNYLEKLSQNFWQFQVSYPPIIELKEFKFKIGNADLVDIDNDMFTVNEQMGTIEFIPYPSEKGAGYFSYMIASMAGIGLAIHTVGGYERIPNMFYVKYKSGIIHSGTDTILKEGIRDAVAKRALREMITLSDPKRTKSNRSENIDGSSASETYNTDKIIEELKSDEADFIWDLRNRYGKNVNIGVL